MITGTLGTELLPRDNRKVTLPPDERRCTATAKTGERCTAWTMKGTDLCSGHGGNGFSTETAVQAQERSVKARQRYAMARKLVGTGGTVTADDILRLRLAEEAVEVAETMLAPLSDTTLGTIAKANHAAMLQDRARPDLRPDILAAITLERAKATLSGHNTGASILELGTAELEAIAGEWEEVA